MLWTLLSSAVPTAKVRTDIGTFEIEQNVNSRDVYVNWQKIDLVFKNGPDFSYEVQVFDDNSGRWVCVFVCHIVFRFIFKWYDTSMIVIFHIIWRKRSHFFILPCRQINKTSGEVEIQENYAKFSNMENNVKFR